MAGPTASYVRFTGPAVADLEVLEKKDPQIVRHVLKKCLLLERNPYAGEPLIGNLIGYRKLVVGDRHWRLVWRVIQDEALTIEISEIWGVGARSEAEVYAEMIDRIASMPHSPLTQALDHVAAIFAPNAGLDVSHEPGADPIPDWLRQRLIYSAGMRDDQLEGVTGAHAADLWDEYTRRDRS